MRYTFIFRVGGTDNFHWQRALVAEYKRFLVEQYAKQSKRMGFPVAIVDADRVEREGLPSTYNLPEGFEV